ncbi:hypothetical protein SESBI_13455 [Sesbania bispinosa]|nr:hypothetical protein SESBI_13455 [Sesbania bispinosa]
METGGDNKSNATLGTGPATNIDEHEVHQTSSQNPFLVQNETHYSATDDLLGLHSSFPPSTYETSPGNPFHEQTNTNNNNVPAGAFESWQNQPTTCGTAPTNVESHNPFQVTEQGHHGMPNNNLGSPASESPNQEHIHVSVNDTNKPLIESSDDDVPVSSMPKHGRSGDVVGQHSPTVSHGSNGEIGINKGSEIQNPPVQVMERPGESGTSSQYVFPSHVFARNNTNGPVEWSTASNESLFSIYMGNMSFSNELVCFKSCELDKPGDVNLIDPPNASPSQQPPIPVNKFNDISQRTAELHEERKRATEAKAAETMREVIMESSQNVGIAEDKNSNSHRQSDGSTKSYAFQTSRDGDKSISSKSVGEKLKQQKQSEEKETADAVDQAPKSTTNNAPPNKWLGCFSCCTSCH